MEESTVDRVPWIEVSFRPCSSRLRAKFDGCVESYMTASSPRALTVINIIIPMIKKSISYLIVSFCPLFFVFHAVFLQEKLVLHGRGHLQNQ